MKRLLLILSAVCLFSPVWSQPGGSTSYQFLNLVSSARVASLGGNLLAVKDSDVTLGQYNPSLLNPKMDQDLAMSYVNYFSNINFGFVTYARTIDSVGTFAATLHYLDYGKFIEADETGEQTGQFSAGDYVLSLGVGRELDSLFSIGANLKLFYSNYYIYNSFGMAVDVAGTYYKPSKGFTASVILKNMGYQLKPYTPDNREKMPFEIQLAISKKLAHAPFRFSIAAENLQTWDLSYIDPTLKPQIDPSTGAVIPPEPPGFGDKLMRHMVFGTELVTRNFSVGFGYNYRRRKELRYAERGGIAGFSFGLGVRIKKVQVAYGLASYHLAGTSHHLTISLKLSELKSKF